MQEELKIVMIWVIIAHLLVNMSGALISATELLNHKGSVIHWELCVKSQLLCR